MTTRWHVLSDIDFEPVEIPARYLKDPQAYFGSCLRAVVKLLSSMARFQAQMGNQDLEGIVLGYRDRIASELGDGD